MQKALRSPAAALLLTVSAFSAGGLSPQASAARADAVTQWTEFAIDRRTGG
jgi:hypothetical protein